VNLQGQRDLVLLSELERDGNVTQRTLATKLGVALGLTNLYIKRLARKGFIKITTIPPHRIKYILTPQGFAEKSRLTYQYMQYSLSYYRDIRDRLRKTLAAAVGMPVVALFGPTSEVRTGPHGGGHRVLTSAVPCRPCYSRVCRHAVRMECLHAIKPEEAAKAVLQVVTSRPLS
jgi:DNA-binding MarR family transcriptional regulator